MSEVKEWLIKANALADKAEAPIPASQKEEAIASLCWGCKHPMLAQWIIKGLIRPTNLKHGQIYETCLVAMSTNAVNDNLPRLERKEYFEAYKKLMNFESFEEEKRSFKKGWAETIKKIEKAYKEGE